MQGVALEEVMASVRKLYGSRAAFSPVENPLPDVDVIPTGIVSFDWMTGIGGIPRGRVTELFGPFGGGKSTLCLQIIKETMKMELVAVLIDTEGGHTSEWMVKNGVDVNSGLLVLSQPEPLETMLEVACRFCVAGVGLVVIDSIIGVEAGAQAAADIADNPVAIKARILSRAMPRLVSAARSENVAVVFTNQIREQIGVMYGNPETTPGGHAPRYAASLRVRVSRQGKYEEEEGGGKIITQHKAKVHKSRLGPLFREAEFTIDSDIGIEVLPSLVRKARELGVLVKADGTPAQRDGTKLHFQGEPLGDNDSETCGTLWQKPDLAEQIRCEVYARLFKRAT